MLCGYVCVLVGVYTCGDVRGQKRVLDTLDWTNRLWTAVLVWGTESRSISSLSPSSFAVLVLSILVLQVL